MGKIQEMLNCSKSLVEEISFGTVEGMDFGRGMRRISSI